MLDPIPLLTSPLKGEERTLMRFRPNPPITFPPLQGEGEGGDGVHHIGCSTLPTESKPATPASYALPAHDGLRPLPLTDNVRRSSHARAPIRSSTIAAAPSPPAVAHRRCSETRL